MTDEHARYEKLAVGHVLGGLAADEAADFRSHLLGCRYCRSRVAELRGIAADLAAAERDEKAQSRLRTEAPRRVMEEDEEAADSGQPRRITVRHVTVATVVVLVLAIAMAFWNLHLRTTSSMYAAVAEQRGDVLSQLATGIPLDADLESGVTGQVVTDGDRVAFSLAGIQPPAAGERLVGWLLDGSDGSPTLALLVRSGQIDDGTLAASLERHDAAVLVLTRERGQPGEGPTGQELLRVRLDAGG